MNPDTARAKIQRLEEQVAQQLGTEIKVYGSGSQGYEKLNNFLREGDRSLLNRSVKKQLHEYWVFLLVVQLTIDEYNGKSEILYKPAKGGSEQPAVVDSIFVEPKLPIYPTDQLWNDYGTEAQFLQNLGAEGEQQHHTTPDLLIAKDGVGTLPWGAHMGRKTKDLDTLMRWCTQAEYDKIRKELELTKDFKFSNFRECSSIVQTLGKKEDPEEAHQKWTEFSDRAEYLLECKHRPPTESDLSQVLWYAIAYDTPITLVTAERLTQHRRTFESEIDRLPVDVKLVEGVDFESVSDSREKLAFLQ